MSTSSKISRLALNAALSNFHLNGKPAPYAKWERYYASLAPRWRNMEFRATFG